MLMSHLTTTAMSRNELMVEGTPWASLENGGAVEEVWENGGAVEEVLSMVENPV